MFLSDGGFLVFDAYGSTNITLDNTKFTGISSDYGLNTIYRTSLCIIISVHRFLGRRFEPEDFYHKQCLQQYLHISSLNLC
jgi:hypothetical protein